LSIDGNATAHTVVCYVDLQLDLTAKVQTFGKIW